MQLGFLKRAIWKSGILAIGLLGTVTLAYAQTETSDFDNDGTDDYTVYRQSTGEWYIRKSSDSSQKLIQWGLSDDSPVSGIYTGASGPDLAVFRPSTGVWYLKHWDSGLDFSSNSSYQWGGFSGDIPYPCDFTGDGKNEIAIYRPSDGNWYLRNSDTYTTFTVRAFGTSSSTPIALDYDNDSTCDFAVYESGTWSILLSSTNNVSTGTIEWGLSNDIPVPGKYDNDNIVDFAVYREVEDGNSMWLIRESRLAGLTSKAYLWGEEGDFPITKDIDGDGKTDIVVWRPSNGTWYSLASSLSYGGAITQQWGLPDDIPLGDRRGSEPY
jgi:hypothetical protein